MKRATVPLLAVAATFTFAGAAAVLVFGVIATSGVYGSRMAWFLGVAVPLLALTAAFAGLAARPPARVPDGPASGPRGYGVTGGHVLCAAAIVVLGIPAALAAALLCVDGLLFALQGISQLL